MDREIRFTGRYEVQPLRVLTPASWYIGFACRHCHQHFAMIGDPTDTGELRLSGDARFHIVCPNCGESADYGVEDLVLFQAAQGGAISTA